MEIAWRACWENLPDMVSVLMRIMKIGEQTVRLLFPNCVFCPLGEHHSHAVFPNFIDWLFIFY